MFLSTGQRMGGQDYSLSVHSVTEELILSDPSEGVLPPFTYRLVQILLPTRILSIHMSITYIKINNETLCDLRMFSYKENAVYLWTI